jgi:hypothetical protein
MHFGCAIIVNVRRAGTPKRSSDFTIHLRQVFISDIAHFVKIAADIKAESIRQDDQHVFIAWSDGHQSRHELTWLQHHNSRVAPSATLPGRETVLWNADILTTMPSPTVSFEEVMKSDDGLAQWLKRVVRTPIYRLIFIGHVWILLC